MTIATEKNYVQEDRCSDYVSVEPVVIQQPVYCVDLILEMTCQKQNIQLIQHFRNEPSPRPQLKSIDTSVQI